MILAISQANAMTSMSLDAGCNAQIEQDMLQTATPASIESPVAFLRYMLPSNGGEPTQNTLFSLNKRDPMDGYCREVVDAIRSDDIATLRCLLRNGQSFDVCNTNGEYLIHLACRRSSPATVCFLVDEAKVRLDVRDTMGRTILHDICWRPTPDLQIMSTILRLVSPELLLAKDIRGHTPFDFARKHHWMQWIHFLQQHQSLIQTRLSMGMGASY